MSPSSLDYLRGDANIKNKTNKKTYKGDKRLMDFERLIQKHKNDKLKNTKIYK